MSETTPQVRRVNRLIVLCGLAILTSIFWTRQPVSAVQDKPVKKWLYTTETVDAPSLQSKLNELGNGGWEVFSVARANSVIQAPNIECDKWEVTAKRPM